VGKVHNDEIAHLGSIDRDNYSYAPVATGQVFSRDNSNGIICYSQLYSNSDYSAVEVLELGGAYCVRVLSDSVIILKNA
jgi:hypothetical protein